MLDVLTPSLLTALDDVAHAVGFDPTVLIAAIITFPPTVSALFAARQAMRSPPELTAQINDVKAELELHTEQDDASFKALEIGQARMEGRLEEVLKHYDSVEEELLRHRD